MRWLPILFTLVGCITSRIQSVTSQAACSQSWSSIGPKTVDIYDNNYPVGIGAMSDLILRGSTLYVGAVNGGVWKTDNFREPTPTYKPLTDQQRCNGITALAAHPTNNQFVVAGCGSGSNAGVGGDWQGILITTDGGTTWKRAVMPNLGKTQLEVTSILVLSNNNILVATRLSRVKSSGGQYINQLDPEVSGIFRSTDSGTTFTKVRKGWTFTLKTDAAETEIYAVGSKALANDAWGNAVYVSKDQGATWSEYTNGLALGTAKDNNGCGLKNVVPSSARLAVSSNTTHQTMLLVIFTASKDQYCYDYYASTDHGVFWSVVGVSSEGKQFFPNVDVMGNQGITDLYLLADPANIGIFYLGGTDLARYRLSVQDLGDSYGVSQPILITFPRRPPEQIGNATEKLNTHADARSAIWDPQENAIIETNDGGIWALANPRDPEGSEWVWSRLPTDFATSEQNAVAYDPGTGIVVAAAQDNAVQISKTSVTSPNYDFFTTGPGDGVTAAVDRTVTPAVFHTGIQRLQLVISFPAGATLNARPGEFFFGYTKPFNYQPYGGDSEDSLFKDAVFDFTPKIKTNPYKSNQTMLCSVTPPQCALVYRRDRKPTVSDQITIINSGEKYGVWAQGGMKNGQSSATVYWAVGGTSVWTQDDARGSKVTRTLPWSGTATGIDTKDTFRVFAIAVDPRDYYTAYVTTSEQKLYRSTDFGSTWVVHPFPSQPWAVIVIPINITTSAVLVGTQNGIYVAYDNVPWPWTWRLVGLGIPNVLVTEFDYDSGTDLLVVSTMGRGIWSFPALTTYLAASGNCPTPDQDYFVIATKEGTYTPPTSGSGDGKTSAASLKHPAFIWTGAMIFIVRWLMF